MNRPRSYRAIDPSVVCVSVALACGAGPAITQAFTIAGPTNHVTTVNLTGFPASVTSAKSTLQDFAHMGVPGGDATFVMTYTDDAGQYPGWTHQLGNELEGTLQINDYKATAPEDRAGGARFTATYTPSTAETDMPGFVQGLRWVQMFTTPLSGTHIDPYPNDDEGDANTDASDHTGDLPFYYTEDEHGTHGLTFIDNPAIGPTLPASNYDYSATFELYVVGADFTNKVITIYDGVKWGYDVAVTIPEPASGAAVLVLCLVTLRQRRGCAA